MPNCVDKKIIKETQEILSKFTNSKDNLIIILEEVQKNMVIYHS